MMINKILCTISKIIYSGGQSFSTDGRSVSPSLTDSRFAGEMTNDGNFEITDGISANG